MGAWLCAQHRVVCKLVGVGWYLGRYMLNTTFLKDVEVVVEGWALDGSTPVGKVLNDFSRPFRM